MKFKAKNRAVIGAIITALLLGFGVAGGPQVAPVLTELTCQAVGCDDGGTTGG